MKTYVKPELNVESLFSKTAVANDPFDFGGGNGTEVEISSTDWWDIL